MTTPTYTPLANVTLGTATSSVSFSAIPASYRDLILVVTGRSTYTPDGGESVSLRVNGDSGSNYPYVRMGGTGSGSGFSDAGTLARAFLASIRASESSNTSPGVAVIQIMDYSATDKHKSMLGRGSSLAGDGTTAHAVRWANTNAITSIQVIPDRQIQGASSNWATGTTFNLFGVIA
jgi:hypothetical protein